MDWRKTREYRIWRATVIRRDKRCKICNSIQHREAHHLDSASYFKDSRFDPDNGICLCRSCHFTLFHIHFKGGTRKKCTRKDFERFTDLVTDIKKL